MAPQKTSDYCCAYAARRRLPADRCPFRNQPDHSRSKAAQLSQLLATLARR